MPSAWLLPEHIADVLPAQARHIEKLRRGWLDMACSYGFELVMPPLLEYLDSLLSGTSRALDLKTFKLVDQLDGRALGVRADSTPQAARIDAHLLNRRGVTRLCYCGPVLHTQPAGPRASREPLQWGAEIYGHSGLEADLEVLDLALDGLRHAGLGAITLDLGHAGILRGLLNGMPFEPMQLASLHDALARKDADLLARLTSTWPEPSRQGLHSLLHLYGGADILQTAASALPAQPLIAEALSDLCWLANHLQLAHPDVHLGFDLADPGRYAYYSGAHFAIYVPGASDQLVSGGRYDAVGAAFGRKRPAVGFGLDLKALAQHVQAPPPAAAIRAPWSDDAALRATVRRLREQGESVVCMLPGHALEGQEFNCDRELVAAGDQWVVRAL